MICTLLNRPLKKEVEEKLSFFELSFEMDQEFAEAGYITLENLGAVAVSLYDAQDQPLLEPLPGTTPLWPKVKVVGLFDKEVSVEMLETLKSVCPGLEYRLSPLEDKEWTRTWLDHFKPMQFGQRLWIAPFSHPFETEDKDAIIIRLDPGLAFGTGTHPTTELCLRWLDAHPPLGQHVIDYGCGSGILGIAALLLGAKKVTAIDYDPQALLSTRENAHRNQIKDEELVKFHSEQVPIDLPKAQSVLANILAEPLIQLAPKLREACDLGGTIVLSGLLTSQIEAVKAAYDPWFQFDPAQIKEDWVLLTAKRIA